MLETLELIARFCHLRVRDVARAFAWSEHKARRQLNSLERDKLLLSAKRPERTKVYGLSARGRNYIKANSSQDVSCASSLKYLRSLGNYEHRCLANQACLYYCDAFSYSTEFEIQTGKAPVKSLAGKIPDALIYTEQGVIWVEVERSKRNEIGWADLLNWFVLVFDRSYPEKPILSEQDELYIFRLEFYCNRSFIQSFFNRLQAKIGEIRAKDLIDCYTVFTPLDFFDY
jgi:hypothetical protein